ncbi:unnamed protein product [Caenorhabditis angaria]|uniref:ShKT domain-containing protein n=1 Tax=Caenorhabditis angaria TaxID=860376 RepID=A0A9P1I7N4_9PELO|nr:unnamed protein product [Caenorhabditis angaria]
MKFFLVFFISLVAVTSAAETCQSGTTTAPCDSTLPCPSGYTCDSTGSCCLTSNIVSETTSTTTKTTTKSATTKKSSTTCHDKLNPVTGVSDCLKRANLCSDSAYYDVMTVQCPKTCGRCSSLSTSSKGLTGSCVDLKNPNTGISDCPRLKYLCSINSYKSLMIKQCPKTCGFCNSSASSSSSSSSSEENSNETETSCLDKINKSTGISDCSIRQNLCHNAIYRDLMKTQCPKTCGYCN